MSRALRSSPPDYLHAVALVQEHGVRAVDATNSRGQTLLHASARDDAVDYAALLLARGASPVARDISGAQPLRACTEGGSPSLRVARLLCAVQEVRKRINDRGTDGACVVAIAMVELWPR